MKAFFSGRAAGWIFPILGLLFLSLLVWFFGPFIAFASWIPLAGVAARLATIFLVFLIWGINRFRKHRNAVKADQGLADEIVGDERADGSQAAMQSDEEVTILRDRFEDAVQMLRKRSDRRGALSLYELPWYVIVGPPGSGKTTALVNSGLHFPLEQRYGKEALRGVGGTRNCDWWFTDDAVLLDTAGRYLTQDSHESVDKSAWEGFLDLLKKYRKRQPINGVLVAVSISDLLLQTEAERKAQVLAIRNRVQELYKHFGIRFPVYMLFTKCDLIAGFTEFFDDLDVEGRQQPLGMTFPFDESGKQASDEVDRFDAEFEQIMERINGRLTWRLSQEKDAHRAAKIFGFPQQLSGLRENLTDFLKDVFRSSRYDTPVMLRGVYFTSGTQEGMPIDRLMSVMARTFNMSEQALPSMGGQGRSYFITDLFRKIIFFESGIAGTNRRVERHLRWLQNGAYVGAIAIGIGLALAWVTSFRANSQYIEDVGSELQVYNDIAQRSGIEAVPPDGLLPRLNALAAVRATAARHEGDVPWHMRMWLYQGRGMKERVHDAYLRELNQALAPPILEQIALRIRENADNAQLLYEYLKAYLMLGDPQRLDPNQLSYLIDAEWQRSYGPGAITESLREHSNYLIQNGAQPHPINERLVGAARATLAQAPLSDFLYSRLKLDATEYADANIRLNDRLGLSADKVFIRDSGASMNATIPALFTRQGFEDIYPQLVARLLVEAGKENWVLGREDASLGAREKLGEYIETWSDLLSDLKIVPFTNTAAGVETLSLISATPSVLQELLELVEENTNLTKDSGAVDAALDAAKTATRLPGTSRLSRILPAGERAVDAAEELQKPGESITKHFEQINSMIATADGQPGPINQVLLLVGDLRDEIESTGRGIGQRNALETLTTGGSLTAQQIRGEARRQPEPIKSWLLQIGGGSGALTAGSARAALGEKLKQDVASQCRNLISGRYPFERNSSEDVTVDDFGRVFGYGGILDRFFEENLAPLVDRSGTTWRWRDGGDASLGMSNRVLQKFQRAAAIREVYFRPGAQTPEMLFTMIPESLDADVARFVITVDDQSFDYRHGPPREWNVKWPSSSFGEARIMFEEASGGRPTVVERGPWALRMRSVRNPLASRDIEGFECPSGL
jgi:type VI secretion system protein ImpL